MSKPRTIKISKSYLFSEAVYYYEVYAQTRDQLAYGRYCELRDIMLELNLSQEYMEYRFGKDVINGTKKTI